MKHAVEHLHDELKRLRTGRASIGLLDGVMVDYYGTPTPLKQVANLSVADATMLMAQPWDAKQIPAIERAIAQGRPRAQPDQRRQGRSAFRCRSSTEERRKELVKKAHEIAEHARTAIRGARREANDKLKKMEKDDELSQDDERRGLDEVQKLHDHYIAEVGKALRAQGKRHPGRSERRRDSRWTGPAARSRGSRPRRRCTPWFPPPAAARASAASSPSSSRRSPAGRCWPGRSSGCSPAASTIGGRRAARTSRRGAAGLARATPACALVAGGDSRQASVALGARRVAGAGRGSRRWCTTAPGRRVAAGRPRRGRAPRRPRGRRRGARAAARRHAEAARTSGRDRRTPSTATGSSAPRRRRSFAARLLERALARGRSRSASTAPTRRPSSSGFRARAIVAVEAHAAQPEADDARGPAAVVARAARAARRLKRS